MESTHSQVTIALAKAPIKRFPHNEIKKINKSLPTKQDY